NTHASSVASIERVRSSAAESPAARARADARCQALKVSSGSSATKADAANPAGRARNVRRSQRSGVGRRGRVEDIAEGRAGGRLLVLVQIVDVVRARLDLSEAR